MPCFFQIVKKLLSRRIRPSYCGGARGGSSPPRMGSNALNALHGKAFSERSEDFSPLRGGKVTAFLQGGCPAFS